MTRTDQKILFTALGFLAVIVRDVPQDKQALRAMAVAKLIEDFCMSAVASEAMTPPDGDKAETANMFADLLNDNQKDGKLRDAMQALSLLLDGENSEADKASESA